ncbi:MAG TPA: hypothetical protein VGJ55_06410 [Pyrinomonadaceae bacterium]
MENDEWKICSIPNSEGREETNQERRAGPTNAEQTTPPGCLSKQLRIVSQIKIERLDYTMLLLTPLAAAAFMALENALCFVIVVSDCDDCGFNDLGLLLFGGLVLAIGVGVGFTLIRLRLSGSKTKAPAFLSITPHLTNIDLKKMRSSGHEEERI